MRAAFNSMLGVKIPHVKMQAAIYNAMLAIEGDERKEAIIALEKKVGITYDKKTKSGKETWGVFMSKEDAKDRNMKTFEETIDERAAKIEIPKALLEKVDACFLLKKDSDNAFRALHKELHEKLPPTFKVFTDLEARAEKYKAEKDEQDVDKLTELHKRAEGEKTYVDGKREELGQRKGVLDTDIKSLEEESTKLKNECMQEMSDDNEDRVREIMSRRRHLRTAVDEKNAELASLLEVIQQYATDGEKLREQINELSEKIKGGAPPTKRQKKK